jgi:hypothetical protein
MIAAALAASDWDLPPGPAERLAKRSKGVEK